MKRTYFCIDVSGSMSDQDIKNALDAVHARSKPGDFLTFFDVEAYGPLPVEEAFVTAKSDKAVLGRGGTDPLSALQASCEHAQAHGIDDMHIVIISDGCFPPLQNESVEVIDIVHKTQAAPTGA